MKTKKTKKGKERKGGKDFEKRLHEFLKAWKGHVRDEISIHKKLLEGRQSFKQHLDETVRIHEKFVRQIKKI